MKDSGIPIPAGIPQCAHNAPQVTLDTKLFLAAWTSSRRADVSVSLSSASLALSTSLSIIFILPLVDATAFWSALFLSTLSRQSLPNWSIICTHRERRLQAYSFSLSNRFHSFSGKTFFVMRKATFSKNWYTVVATNWSRVSSRTIRSAGGAFAVSEPQVHIENNPNRRRVQRVSNIKDESDSSGDHAGVLTCVCVD